MRFPLSLPLLFVLLSVAAPTSRADVSVQFRQGWPVVEADGVALTHALPEPAVRVTVEGEPVPAPTLLPESGTRQTVYRGPEGVLLDSIEPFVGFSSCFVRTVVYQNGTDRSADLIGADFRLAPTVSGNAPRWQAQSFALVECRRGGPTLCTAFTSEDDRYRCELRQGDQPLIRHHVDTAWRLPPGGRAVIGKQYMWVCGGDLERARTSVQDWYDAVGVTVADDGPPWLGDCVLYEASAGGSVDSRWGDTGGFDNFARRVDFLYDLGCNALWLMSVLTHKDPRNPRDRWNLYDPLNYHEVDPAYGGEAGLSRLVEKLHDRGLRVFNEIVPHGGHAPVAEAHPEWWTYGPDGKRLRHFGQSLDYSAPGWQAVVRNTIQWLTAGWHFDGYRVDVADGFGVNWKSPVNGAHVSRSTLGGSLGMLRAIRLGALAGGATQPVVIPETGTNRPEYARFGQVGYGFPFLRGLETWFTDDPSPVRFRQALTRYFDGERGSLPRGMLVLRALNNHDTVVAYGRADRRFGVGLQRALMGVCCVVPGVPMLYDEQETGSYHTFRRLFWGRRRTPEMCRGAADYLAVEAAPEVFTVLRTHRNGYAVGLVNLSGKPVTTDVVLPSHLIAVAGATLYDAVSGRRQRAVTNTFRWSLAPFETAMLRLGAPPVGDRPAERHPQESTTEIASEAPLSWRRSSSGIEYTGGGLRVDLRGEGMDVHVERRADGGCQVVATAAKPGPAKFAFQVLGCDRWFAAAVTGVYEDRLLRRHYPWPADRLHWDPGIVWGYEPYHLYRGRLPCGRQWQSAVAPLARAAPQLVFAGRGGRGVMIERVAATAMNIVLTDDSERPDPGPSGLTLEFLAHDDVLNPRWQPGYRRFEWMEVPQPAFSHTGEPLHVRFVLKPLPDYAAALRDALRRPVSPPAQRKVGPGHHRWASDRLWLVEPNTVSWRDLRVSRSGTYTLWLQLRHSERGPADTGLSPHYRVVVDGRRRALEWRKLDVWHTGNAYFGWAAARLGRLAAGPHSMTVTTSHSWCALHPRVYLSRDPTFAP